LRFVVFTKIAGQLMLDVRDLVNWGFETGNTTPERMRLTVAARQEAAVKLVESGMSQRQAAKLLGVAEGTIRNDVRKSSAESAQQLRTPATRTRQANEQKRRAVLQAPAEVALPPDLYVGDFRKLAHRIPDDSVQLIFTDPPYDADSVKLYRDAASVAARILKPGGSFIAYSGQRHLPAVLRACRPVHAVRFLGYTSRAQAPRQHTWRGRI
jgi:16S rRNA G966 N2-methylase RsmD